MKATNILLVRKGCEDEYQMLEAVTLELRKLGIRARLVWDSEPRLKHLLWSLGAPTYVVSFRPIQNFLPSWAKILQQERHNKISEYEELRNAGIPVPKWRVIYEGGQPDLSDFPEFFFLKPNK